MLFVWPSVNELSVLDTKEVNPEIVVAVPPSAIAVPPIVTEEFANWPLGIALVPKLSCSRVIS